MRKQSARVSINREASERGQQQRKNATQETVQLRAARILFYFFPSACKITNVSLPSDDMKTTSGFSNAVAKLRASENRRSLVRFGELNFHLQEINHIINIRFLSISNNYMKYLQTHPRRQEQDLKLTAIFHLRRILIAKQGLNGKFIN